MRSTSVGASFGRRPRTTALSDAYSPESVFDLLWKRSITGDCGSTFNVALAELGIFCDGPLMHKLVEVYMADNETKDLIAPNRLGLLTIQLLRPSALCHRPSPPADAAPRVKIAAIGELTGVLAQFAQRP